MERDRGTEETGRAEAVEAEVWRRLLLYLSLLPSRGKAMERGKLAFF